MTIDTKHTAALAKIAFDETALDDVERKIADVMKDAEVLLEIDTSEEESLSLADTLREDIPKEGNLRDEILAGAVTKDGCVSVPRVVE